MVSACLIRKILVLWISSWTLTWQVPAKNRYYRFREFCEVPTNTGRYRYWEITNILYRFCRKFVILVLKSTKNNECWNIGISICNAISDWNGIMRLFCWFCTNFSRCIQNIRERKKPVIFLIEFHISTKKLKIIPQVHLKHKTMWDDKSKIPVLNEKSNIAQHFTPACLSGKYFHHIGHGL